MPNDVNLDTKLINECIVDVDTQTMSVHLKNGFIKTYPISTATNGTGCESGSYKTPFGIHKVDEKIGAFAPSFSIFKSRIDTGKICDQINMPIQDDLILTRILRLRGMEPGVNVGESQDGICIDSWQRYIYIHGTNREDLIGTQASHGCIRMRNADIEELFMKIQQDTTVVIRPKLHST